MSPSPDRAALGFGKGPTRYPSEQPNPLAEARELLANEIKRGKEYLAQVQGELRENRDLLEHWAQYELTCSLRPLDHLVRSVWLKERVEQFLIGWLARKEKQLAKVSGKLQPPAGNGKRHRPL